MNTAPQGVAPVISDAAKSVIPAEDLRRLEALVTRATNLFERMETTAKDLRDAAKTVNESLKRATALNQPQRTPQPPKLRTPTGAVTTLSAGPMRILEALNIRSLSMASLSSVTGLTNSTLRTYIPTLRKAGYIVGDGSDYHITKDGLAELQFLASKRA